MTLEKRHLQLFHKRLRNKVELRHFGCGEYGEQFGRPHYHDLLFGVDPERHRQLVEDAWQLGHVHVGTVTAGSVSYVAGYCSKKLAERQRVPEERVDPATGEVYTWQPPFRLMSRRPGIGAAAGERYSESWRSFAVFGGRRMGVPRYLHERWREKATPEEVESLMDELERLRPLTAAQREARGAVEVGRYAQQRARRMVE